MGSASKLGQSSLTTEISLQCYLQMLHWLLLCCTDWCSRTFGADITEVLQQWHELPYESLPSLLQKNSIAFFCTNRQKLPGTSTSFTRNTFKWTHFRFLSSACILVGRCSYSPDQWIKPAISITLWGRDRGRAGGFIATISPVAG